MLLAEIHWHSCLFMLFAALTCLFAVAVLVSSHVVRMAAFLVVCLTGNACLFMLAGAEFLGAMQIMIYVGGTLVLLIFGVMLTAQATQISLKSSAGEWTVAAIVGGSLLFMLVAAALSVPAWRTPGEATRSVSVAATKTSAPIGLSLLGVRAEAEAMGKPGVSGYLLPFEIVSVHLLVVLIGAAYLARTQRRLPVSNDPRNLS